MKSGLDIKIITNNPLVVRCLSDYYEIEYHEISFREILVKVRDLVYEGYELRTHPIAGSVKPNETPYKSIVLSKKKLDFVKNCDDYAKYAKLLTERALLEMEEGYIRPTPYDNHCEYCAYGGICGREEFLHGAPRTVGEVSEGTIVAAVDAEEGGYARSGEEGDVAVATSTEGEKGNAAPFRANSTLKKKGAAAATPNFDLKNTQKEEG